MLILALVIVISLAGVTAAIAEFAFVGVKASNVHADRQRLVLALDSGLQASIENLRRDAGSSPCVDPGSPLTIADIDDTAGATPPPGVPPPITVIATCTEGPPDTYSIDVVAYSTKAECPPGTPAPPVPTSELTFLQATVSVLTTASGQRVPRVASWNLEPDPSPCTEVP